MLKGRDTEMRRCVEALDGCVASSRRIELIGAPGIGKSTIFDEVVRCAGGRGFRVLSSRPSQAESALAFAGLGDLLAHIDDVGMLSAPQQRALDIALERISGNETPTSIRTLGAGVRALLQSLSAESPLLVAIDDLQWLDAATAEVLAFVMRRIPERNTVVLVAHRSDLPAQFGSDELIELGPLADEVTRTIAMDSATSVLPTNLIDRIVESSAGSPLYAIELVRSISSRDLPSMTSLTPLPVPASLGQLVADRVTALPSSTTEALAFSALLAAPTIESLAALGVLDHLAPAEVAGIVEIVGRDVRFAHPLLASAAHDAMTGTQRLRMHRRLAEVTDGLQRCIHLALGTDRRDAAVAAELWAALPALAARGASAEAAELAVLALSITPNDDPDRHERLLVSGDMLFRAGRTEEALTHLERARAEAPDNHLLARALLGLATIEYSHVDNAANAEQLASRAVELTDDPLLLAEAHSILARVVYTDFAAAADHAAEALRLLEKIDTSDGPTLAMALNASASANFMAGRGLDRAMFERAIELERGLAVSPADSAAGALAAFLKYADDLEGSRRMLMALVDDADEASLPYVLGHLPQLELWTGRWDDAERSARRQLDLARQTDQESQVQGALFNLAVVAAFRGDVDAAKPLAAALYEEGRSTGSLWTERSGAAVLGFLAMSVGDAEGAVDYLGRYEEIGENMGLHDPGYVRFHGDYVEALVAVGDIAAATELLDRIEPRAVRLDRPSAIGTVHRGRALVFAHAGDMDAAIAAARRAVAALDDTQLVYDKARALMTLGIVLRRFKLKAEARVALTAALEMLESMGARSLIERVKVELDRLGVRSGTPLKLTQTEARVAELAASGRTTRQIADALFMSAKTVEAHMTRIYRKLGVSNRAVLASRATAHVTT